MPAGNTQFQPCLLGTIQFSVHFCIQCFSHLGGPLHGPGVTLSRGVSQKIHGSPKWWPLNSGTGKSKAQSSQVRHGYSSPGGIIFVLPHLGHLNCSIMCLPVAHSNLTLSLRAAVLSCDVSLKAIGRHRRVLPLGRSFLPLDLSQFRISRFPPAFCVPDINTDRALVRPPHNFSLIRVFYA